MKAMKVGLSTVDENVGGRGGQRVWKRARKKDRKGA